jgi:dTDP-4-amino-4,6-dideoxygalactose transaminase
MQKIQEAYAMYRIGKEELAEIKKVIDGRVLFRVNNQEKEVERFEKEWADTIGTKYALCVSGGTNALVCALAGMGVGPGDEVIVPGYTFMATALAAVAVGAVPVIAEIDETLTIDPDDVEKKISPRTKVIAPVHICGFPADMERITAIAKKHGIKVLEDSCQADGGSYKGRRLGTWGDAGVFSFNDYKILTSGEGGIMVTDDPEVYERALVFHDGGASFRPYASELSIPIFAAQQYRVSEITGSILRVQLTRLDGILQDLRAVKKRMLDALAGEPGLMPTKSNDAAGDCGTTLAFTFPDRGSAEAFAGSEGVGGWLPINSGKHVYANWDPIMEKNVWHHPAMNPFNFEANKGCNTNYSKDMCPKTLDILARTVFISLTLDWTEAQIAQKIEACRNAARSLRGSACCK